uniref:Feruloyl CoA ortho-hydroxylase 1 n=1 Tax=Noccaea caerulescens TaxID=107243 RepID=A0A1J3GM43_NOCCA
MAPIGLTDVAVTDFVLNQRNGVKGLVDVISPKTLPSRYVQLPEKRVTPEKLMIEATTTGKGGSLSPVIPVIDVADWKNPNVAEEICEAATTLGFFQIVNHGVSLDEQNELRAAGRGFFNLPAEEKKRYWEESSVSETATYMTSFKPSMEAKLEWRDALKFDFEDRYDRVDFAATWPTVCRDEVVNHSDRMKPIGKKILEILMKNLNARMEEQTLMGSLRMNINYYPECPEPKLAVGTGRHCDMNTLTLLLQDDIIGTLYARCGDKWLHVPPVMGALVVNIGDILQILSNDRYKSAEHLVMANQFLSRVSFAYYCGPDYDSVIEPLREVLQNGEKPLYKATKYSDYMKYYFGRPHSAGNKTIESVKLH